MKDLKRIYKTQSIILLLVGVGALFGGGMAIIDPSGALYGAPVEILKKGPFESFLIPGLFLFFVIGVGHLTAFGAMKCSHRLHAYLSGAAGCILTGWILIQCYVLQAANILHIVFFIVGLAESVIALYMLVKLRLFPFKDLG